MNAVVDAILSRRSQRQFTNMPVAQGDIETIIQCGLYAPSGGNNQVVRLMAIENRDVLDKIILTARDEFRKMIPVEGQYFNIAINNANRNPNYDFTFHAPLLILAIAPKGWPNGMADSACALQNIQLATWALGLGGCWVNQLHWLDENKPMRAILAELGVGDHESIYGSVAIGCPVEPRLTQPLPRKENRTICIK